MSEKLQPFKDYIPENQDAKEDPFALFDIPDTGKKWKDKTFLEKAKTVIVVLIKLCLLLGLLYMFICALDFLSSAFKLLGGRAAGDAFRRSDILNNPIADLMLGVLATVLLQSSSTTTSIIVTLVANEIVPVRPAIFMVMGANIGTTVTNTIVSIGHVGNREEFKRAVAGATVHDFFNWLTVLVLLPIEWLSGAVGPLKGGGILANMTGKMVEGLEENNEEAEKDLLKVITKPFTSLVIQVDKKVVTKIAQMTDEERDEADFSDSSLRMVKQNCTGTSYYINDTILTDHPACEDSKVPFAVGLDNGTSLSNCTLGWMDYSTWSSNYSTPGMMENSSISNEICDGVFNNTTSNYSCTADFGAYSFTSGLQYVAGLCEFARPVATSGENGDCTLDWKLRIADNPMPNHDGKVKCDFWFRDIADEWTDAEVGVCVLILALGILIICLICIVKLLHNLLRGSMAIILKKFINSDLPGGKFGRELTGYLAILLGAGFTMLLQSSSIFTSGITPLVGAGVLHIDRMFPLSLGANIGTTLTAILAALAQDIDKLQISMQVALAHLFFNIFGIIIWYPLPFMRKVPISCAKLLGLKVAKYRWVAFVYLFMVFFILPAVVFFLSLAGWKVLLGVMLPIFVFFTIIIIINALQNKHPEKFGSSWSCCPKPLHSVGFYHRCCTRCCRASEDQDSGFSKEIEISDTTPEKTPNGTFHDNEGYEENRAL